MFVSGFLGHGHQVTILDLGRSYTGEGFNGTLVAAEEERYSPEWLQDEYACRRSSSAGSTAGCS